jgi:hypothetical protein
MGSDEMSILTDHFQDFLENMARRTGEAGIVKVVVTPRVFDFFLQQPGMGWVDNGAEIVSLMYCGVTIVREEK